MKLKISIIFFLSGICFCIATYGQRAKAPKTSLAGQFAQKLNIDTGKARQVADILLAYKSAIKAQMQDASLTDAAKRAKVEQLIADKNKQLETVLTPTQMDKIVPLSERKRVIPVPLITADSANKRKYEAYLSKLLSVNDSKAKQVVAILNAYRTSARSVNANSAYAEAARHSKMIQLAALKDKQLSALLTPAQINKLQPGTVIANTASLPEPNAGQIAAVRNDFAKKAHAIFADTLLSIQVRNARVAQLVNERNQQIKSLSTPGKQTAGSKKNN